jgi:hypothetical protein
MSRAKFPLLFTALALAIAMFALQSTVVALQDQAASPSAAQQERDPAAAPNPPTAMPQASDTQTFTGKIAKAGGKYVLKDMTNKMTYRLDDQEKAKEFEGKNVKVSGMLDPATNTIRVAAIEPGS